MGLNCIAKKWLWLNMHNRVIYQLWRDNVDLQVILDRHAAVAYMVKYASKCE